MFRELFTCFARFKSSATTQSCMGTCPKQSTPAMVSPASVFLLKCVLSLYTWRKSNVVAYSVTLHGSLLLVKLL